MKLRDFVISIDTFPADAAVYYDGKHPITLESEVVVWQVGGEASGPQ